MANKYKILEKKMGKERVARAEEKARQIMAEMALSELRKNSGLTQEALAEILKVKQSSLSKMEAQGDMQISTLNRILEALGGHLELIAHMPGGDIRINQFV